MSLLRQNLNKIPFKDLTEDDQTAILLALLRKEPVEVCSSTFSWMDKEDVDIKIYVDRDLCYRLKPKTKAVIPWEHVKENYKYAAMDADGTWCLYVTKPNIMDHFDNEWLTEEDNVVIDHLVFDKGDMPWNESLVCREDQDDECIF